LGVSQQGEFKNTGEKIEKINLGSSHKMWVFFRPFFPPPPSVVWFDFFYRVFGRFVTRGVQKRDKKNRAKISSASKKSTHSLMSLLLLFFSRRPLTPGT
jgi:hypothetical protein